VRKYHTLHSIFERAQRDQVVTFNPCADTKNLTALDRIRHSGSGSRPKPAG
jgi:hypothetical protein